MIVLYAIYYVTHLLLGAHNWNSPKPKFLKCFVIKEAAPNGATCCLKAPSSFRCRLQPSLVTRITRDTSPILTSPLLRIMSFTRRNTRRSWVASRVPHHTPAAPQILASLRIPPSKMLHLRASNRCARVKNHNLREVPLLMVGHRTLQMVQRKRLRLLKLHLRAEGAGVQP